MKDIPFWVKHYIGIPFVSGGRSIREGLDCYGLFRIVQNYHYGKNLPLLSGVYEDANNSCETEKLFKKHRPLIAGIKAKEPFPGCGVILRYQGHPLHIGTYVGGGYILHTLNNTGSVLERAASAGLKNRIEGYYIVS